MTRRFGGLPENIAAFCAFLRRDHAFRIGPRELVDAAHGLEMADIGNEGEVRDILRTILSKTYDDVVVFDAAFARFFRGTGSAMPALDTPGRRGTRAGQEQPGQEGTPASKTPGAGQRDTDAGAADDTFPPSAVRGIAEPDGEAAGALLRASYSPLEAEGTPLVLEPPSQVWLEAAAALARRAHAGASRRWSPSVRGPRFDFRRTLRTSLRTGGEPATPRWRAHARRRPRFVLLVDGSRSMGDSAAPALRTAVALSAVSPNTETFTFSTKLRRVTREARRAAAGERRMLDVQQAWGGGTTIGACLDDFVLHFGERLLGPDAVVIVASDGLDVGSPDLLRESMARLARRSAAVVWLNPLLETAGYEPTAAGMNVARPYASVLTSVQDPAGLRALARTLRVG